MGQYISAFQYLGWAVTHSSKWPSKRYRTEILKFQFLAAIDFPFENDEFLTFQDSTNEFRDAEKIQKDTLDGKIRVFFRSVPSPQ